MKLTLVEGMDQSQAPGDGLQQAMD